MKITLLGMEFAIGNKGCEALSYSFVSEMNRISKELGVSFEYTTVVFAVDSSLKVPSTDVPIICYKIEYSKLNFWSGLWKLFQNSDLIVDLTMGDSFSDIYGAKRFFFATLMKVMAIKSKSTFILGPQTYGPYKKQWVKKMAAHVIKHSSVVYARDAMSKELAEKISSRMVRLTTDVAFALPYESLPRREAEYVHIGFNPSGLLWCGGYTKDNQFHLTVDYKEYCYKVIEGLIANPRYKVYLIPHVGTDNGGGVENDYTVCCRLHEKFPQTTILEPIKTPMDAKKFIASMDVFIGARMHATIAAVSAGVATIPFSYSRKFEGLYKNLQYEHMVHALSDTTDNAIAYTLSCVESYKNLKKDVDEARSQVIQLQSVFCAELMKIVAEVCNQ